MARTEGPGLEEVPSDVVAVPDRRTQPGVRGLTVRIFSSASDAPRARRPTDAVLFALALLGIILCSFPAPGPTAVDRSLTNLISEAPGLLGWFWEITYDLLLLWALFLLVAALVAHGRKRLFLDMLMAAGFAIGFALLAGKAAGTDWSSSLKQIGASGSPPVYLAVRLAVATAVVATASPHMARPLKFVGRWVIATGAVAGIALGTTLPIGMIAGYLIGIGSAALVHLLVGSPGGRLTLDQVSAALLELDIEATDLHAAPLEPSGVAIALGSAADGRSLLIKTFGRDAWDGQLLASVWSSLSHRGETPTLGKGRLQQVEHEAFLTLFAERGGVTVMPVLAAGAAGDGDALLVIEVTGRPLHSLDAAEISDDLLRQVWELLAALHRLGVAHGRVDALRLVVRPDGTPAIADFGEAKIAATPGELLADDAQLLVTTALLAGRKRALTVAAATIGDDAFAELLPYLQPAIVDRATRRAVHDQDWDLKDLRKEAAEQAGTELPALEQVRRVTWRSIAKLAIIAFLAYALISAVANVGLQTLIDEFQGAEWSWLIAALILSPFSQVPQALSTLGATMQEIGFEPVLMLQYGVQFIALAVPSSAARVALEIRFFQSLGVPGAGAISIGMIDSFSTFVLQILLILVITVSGLASLNLSSDSSTSSSGSSINWETIGIIVGLLIVVGIIALAVPRSRAMVARFRTSLSAKAADGRDALRVLRHPSKLLLLLGGNLAAQVMLAIILGMCLRAFGGSASLAELILVNTFVSLFAGFMPVPGGVGVSEAALTAGLIAIGIQEAAATSTAIAFRMVTFYLPPLWGAFAMKWMKKNAYL